MMHGKETETPNLETWMDEKDSFIVAYRKL